MRFSNALRSEMPGPKVYNIWWGDRSGQAQKGIYQYTLSPYQAKAAPQMFRNYLFNGFRRLSVYALPILVPAGIYYYVWTNACQGLRVEEQQGRPSCFVWSRRIEASACVDVAPQNNLNVHSHGTAGRQHNTSFSSDGRFAAEANPTGALLATVRFCCPVRTAT
ncbi:cytochrome b-c1 complex subunit 8 [Mycena polygramma]|nr:cytochrome b-c1 complex subunit 8 [Mycena polygramma]